jgi:hypothetical protein
MTRRERRASANAQRGTQTVGKAPASPKVQPIDPADPFATPQDVAPLSWTLGPLLPDYAIIPEDFKRDRTPWNKLQSRWFFEGLPAKELGDPKSGIDRGKAIRHLAEIQQSFDPAHEHKSAAVAWLMSRWFEGTK